MALSDWWLVRWVRVMGCMVVLGRRRKRECMGEILAFDGGELD